MTSTVSAPSRPAGILARRYRSVTIGLIGVETVVAFEYLAAATAMPTVVRDLHGVALYGWAFGGTLAAAMVCTVVSGIWTDAAGPRKPLWTGLVLLTLGLLGAGTAPTMPVLIAGRVVQGFGGGLIMVALYVIVAQVYPSALKPRVFAALATAWVVPAIVGPAIAGAIVTFAGWEWVFLSAALLVIPLGALMHRSSANSQAPTRVDRPSAARTIAWAVLAAVSIAALQMAGQLEASGIVFAAAAVAGLVLALPRLLPRGTFRAARGVPTVTALRGLTAAAFVAVDVFMPLLLARERGLPPVPLGLAISVAAVAWPVGSWWQSRSWVTWDRARLIRYGAAAMAIGTTVVATLTIDTVPLAAGLAGWVLFGLGMGMIYPALPAQALDLSAEHEQGRNSSALQLADSTANMASVTLAGALFAVLLPLGGAAFLACFGLSLVLCVLAVSCAGRIVPS
ncbi:MAG: MFS transporter [Stackebrandtia sp.]